MKLSITQQYAIECLSRGPMNRIDMVIAGLRKSTMQALESRGLVRYQWSAKPKPQWVLIKMVKAEELDECIRCNCQGPPNETEVCSFCRKRMSQAHV